MHAFGASELQHRSTERRGEPHPHTCLPTLWPLDPASLPARSPTWFPLGPTSTTSSGFQQWVPVRGVEGRNFNEDAADKPLGGGVGGSRTMWFPHPNRFEPPFNGWPIPPHTSFIHRAPPDEHMHIPFALFSTVTQSCLLRHAPLTSRQRSLWYQSKKTMHPVLCEGPACFGRYRIIVASCSTVPGATALRLNETQSGQRVRSARMGGRPQPTQP